MRVALQYAAVHERARIPFVRIADHVFLRAGCLGNRRPLETGRVTRTAATAQPALENRVEHFLGGHFAQHVVQRLVAIRRDIRLNALRVHDAAVGQHDGKLLGEERILWIAHLHIGLAPFEGGDERSRILRSHLLIKRALPEDADLNGRAFGSRVHLHQRSLAAQLHAADPAHFHLVFQTGLFDRFVQCLFNTLGIGRHAARRHAAADDMFLLRRPFLLRNCD